MATRLKTVEYWFDEIAEVLDNTDTDFSQITLYLPESSKVFKSVLFEVLIQDAEATSNNVSTRQLSLQLGSSGYTVITNSTVLNSSGEQKWVYYDANFTSLFTTNWAGASMTCDARVLMNSVIATNVQNWRSATGKLTITYEYDDASINQIKTVKIPLITPLVNLATSKPEIANDTIPALDTFCSEASKSFKQVVLVVQGNDESNSTTDSSISWEIDSLGAFTSPLHEQALNTSCWYRHSQIQSFDSSTTHSFYIWASTTTYAHCQAYLVITYEYNESDSTRILNSLAIPMPYDAVGLTQTNLQRRELTLWIQEPGTISIQRSAAQLFWDQSLPLGTLQFRINDGDWSGALASNAAVVAGSCGASIAFDSIEVTLNRGVNIIALDSFKTSNDVMAHDLSIQWVINYTSDKHPNGSGVHNHTIIHDLLSINTSNIINNYELIPENPIIIPESNWFLNNFGICLMSVTNSSSSLNGYTFQMERLESEGGLKWEDIYSNAMSADNFTGLRTSYGKSELSFRHNSDIGRGRLDPTIARRYRVFYLGLSYKSIRLQYTYHSITYTVSGNISGSNGGNITLRLFSEYTKDFHLQTQRTGNGTYSFTWYDDTQEVWIDAYEDDAHLGRSSKGLAN
jgi:hypothetical protein